MFTLLYINNFIYLFKNMPVWRWTKYTNFLYWNSLDQNGTECYDSLFTDINKFLWMVRIGGSTDRGSHIKEHDYYTPQGEFRVDKDGSPTLLNCLMYKMCYYRFGQVYTEQSKWHLTQYFERWMLWYEIVIYIFKFTDI